METIRVYRGIQGYDGGESNGEANGKSYGTRD